ncbi:MAG: hypothetical protein K2K37_01365, partial [Muribaculaceae bacterium]|nr:hypothetical protein [Muribaculaceae bacterium]
MDYSPRCGVATFSIRTRDDFTGLEKVNVGDINPDGSFEIEVPVSYPQFDYFQLGNINKNLFMIPGDTLSVVTTMAFGSDRHGYRPEYFGYEGTPDDGIAVNLLADSLINIENLYGKYAVAESDAMKSETYKSNERLGALLDSVVTDLPVLLRDVPVSGYAKDLLSAIAIAEICEMMEDLELNFRSSKGPRYVPDNDGKYTYQEGESLDIAEFVAPRMKHKELTYDNPLLVCNGFVLPNRWNFNSLFWKSYLAAIGFSESADSNGDFIPAEDPAEPFTKEKSYLDSIGIGNCFVAQFVRSLSFINMIKTYETPSYQKLERQNRILCQLIKHNGIDVLNDI